MTILDQMFAAQRARPRPVRRIGHADRIFRLLERAAENLTQPGISLRLPAFSLRIELHQDVLKLSTDAIGSGMATCCATAPITRAPARRRTSPSCCVTSRILSRPDDPGDIRDRLAAFLTEQRIRHDGEWRSLPAKYTAPSVGDPPATSVCSWSRSASAWPTYLRVSPTRSPNGMV